MTDADRARDAPTSTRDTAARGTRPPRARAHDRGGTLAGRIAPPALFALAVLALWQVYVALSDVSEALLPGPLRIAQAGWAERGLLLDNTLVTAGEIALGFAAAIALGVGLGLLIASAPVIERAVYPWLVISQLIPIPAIAPIFVLWTGFDLRPKLMVIALVAFFPVVVGVIDGLRAAAPENERLLRTLGASAWQRLRFARLPAALPFFFAGCKVAAALAVIGAVFGEWVGASAGLGYLILVLNNAARTPEMFAAVAVLALLGIALFALVLVAERMLTPWNRDRYR